MKAVKKDLKLMVRKSGGDEPLNKEESQGGDIYQFLAMICSFQAVFFKSKPVFWLSVFLCLSAIFNRRKRAGYTQSLFVIG